MKGRVTALRPGRDGYTAELKDDDGKTYSAVISSVNLAGSGKYREVGIGDSIEVGLRISAARQLAFHIQRFGLLVSNDDLARVRDHAAATTDPVESTAFTSVMGSLKPDAKTTRELILSYPPSTAPLK